MGRLRTGFRSIWRALRRAEFDAAMDDEMRFHIDMEAERFMREEGLDVREARRRAYVPFGARPSGRTRSEVHRQHEIIIVVLANAKPPRSDTPKAKALIERERPIVAAVHTQQQPGRTRVSGVLLRFDHQLRADAFSMKLMQEIDPLHFEIAIAWVLNR